MGLVFPARAGRFEQRSFEAGHARNPRLAGKGDRPGGGRVLAGIALLMLGNGLQGTLLGSRATLEGFGQFVTGMVMASCFAGFVASAEFTPRLMQRIGHVRCYAAFVSCASVAAVLVHGLVKLQD